MFIALTGPRALTPVRINARLMKSVLAEFDSSEETIQVLCNPGCSFLHSGFVSLTSLNFPHASLDYFVIGCFVTLYAASVSDPNTNSMTTDTSTPTLTPTTTNAQIIIGHVLNAKKTAAFDSRGCFVSPSTTTTPSLPASTTVDISRRIHMKQIHLPTLQQAETMTVEDIERFILEQGMWSMWLIKLTDLMVQSINKNIPATKIITAMENLATKLSQSSSFVICESFNNVRKVLDRAIVHQILSDANIIVDGHRISSPVSFAYNSMLPTSTAELKSKISSLSFPFLCKTNISCGTTASHQMYLMSSVEQLSLLPNDQWLCQQFVDHDAFLYKIYVLGEKIYVETRNSIPDMGNVRKLLSNMGNPETECLILDSQKMQLLTTSGKPVISLTKKVSNRVPIDEAHSSFLREIALKVSETFSLTLLGIDLIIASNPTPISADQVISKYPIKYYIVDINYFPSYSDIESFGEDLCIHLQNLYIKNNIK